MFTRILNSRLPLIIYNPSKLFSLNFFKAVFNAGGLPVFDTEFMSLHEILEGVKALIRADILFGIRLIDPDKFLLAQIEELQPSRLDTLVLSIETDKQSLSDKDSSTDNQSSIGKSIRRWSNQTKIILEVREININDRIKDIDPHALILKGNEAGGRVSNYSSFILMQWYLKNSEFPIFIHGGVGRNTASGMFAAGVSGVVLDSQVWLAEESPLSENFRNLLSSLDESDSLEIIIDNKHIFRVFAKLGTKIAKELKEKAILISDSYIDDKSDYKDTKTNLINDDSINDDKSNPENSEINRNNVFQIYKEIGDNITPLDKSDAKAVQSLFFIGQDGFFAKNFALISFSNNLNKSTSSSSKQLPSNEPSSNQFFPNLKDMISGFFKEIGEQLSYVDAFDPMKPDSAMAKDHGTHLPLIQGPMANVSDNADFAAKVLEAGALPFFAVGSLPPALAETMLKNGSEKVSVFGAGLVGIEAFNPAVEKHLELVRKYKAPFALFAGGIPSQVIELEKAGTKTYLHTPSISMMENAIKSGCTRFIFEGREAGGHVGSLSSLVLWEAAIGKLKEKLAATAQSMERTDSVLTPSVEEIRGVNQLSLVFAGGISTCFASCFISGITSCLAAKGIKIGIQVGTAYLFSKEIVETKSIKEQYQTILCEENETVVIGNSVGLASRTAPTDFAKMMVEKEKEMLKKGEKLEDRKKAFERNNIGSLLIGAKGFLPDFKKAGEENYTWFEGEEHKKRGNFLSGDALAFFKEKTTVDQIHSMFFDMALPKSSNAHTYLPNVKATLVSNLNRLEVLSSETKSINDEIAVIGMGCILPDAKNPEELWENILSKRYSIREMEDSRIRKDLYYDPDKTAEDKSYTMLAGYIKDFVFDYERFGYDENKANRLSRSQQILLMAAYQAVENAGYLDENLHFGKRNSALASLTVGENFPTNGRKISGTSPEKTAVIIATCLGNELGNELQLKYHFPEVLSMLRRTEEFNKLSEDEKSVVISELQKGMEGRHQGYDPVHGMLLNIEASRIAKHLGIRGVNYVVDAACASSFSAIDAAIKELLSGDCDHVIVGGVNTHLAPESFVGFCKMGALSAKGSFPFDERADGFVLGEGAAVFVLKRVKDALRDNDNIIGVIKGIGGSSDGRGKAIAAPNVKGQILALKRCYENMDNRVSPNDIGFIEAHGTSTIMGDQAELQTLKEIYAVSNLSVVQNRGGSSHLPTNGGNVDSLKKIGISSVKSQIGHLLGGAGAAGLVKALLAVQKGILPPNANFEKLSHNHDLAGTGLYVIENPEPWITPENKTRMAAISSYGFGGINYHLVIEEFRLADTISNLLCSSTNEEKDSSSSYSYIALPRKIFANPDYDFNEDRIVIAGLGVCLPGGRGVNHFWENLKSGQKQLSEIPKERFDNQSYAQFDKKSHFHLPMVKAGVIQDFKFNNIKYRMPPSIVRSLDRSQLLGLDAADEAINSSGLSKFIQSSATQSAQTKSHLSKSMVRDLKSITVASSQGQSNKIGVILGTIQGERQSKNILRVRKNFIAEIIEKSGVIDSDKSKKIASELVQAIRQEIPENNEDTTPGLLSNIISGRIANHFGLNGVNYVVDASCASSVIAIRNAMRDIASKQLDFALTGGVDANLYPAVLMAFKRLGLLSSTEPRFFDSRADGYAMSEGAAIHVLTTLKKAKDAGMEILGELSDCVVKSSVPDHLLAPSEQTFVSTINECYIKNGIRKQDVGYLDLFAFSNIMGDMVEKQVVEKCFDHINKLAIPISPTPVPLPNGEGQNNYLESYRELYFGNIKTQFGYFKAANPAVALAKMVLMNKNRTLLPNFDYDPQFSTLKNPIIAGKNYNAPSRFAFNVNGIGGNHCHAVLSMVNLELIFGTESGVVQSTAIKDTELREKEGAISYNVQQPEIMNPKRENIVALLSGQGSQSSGMMKEIFERDQDIRQVMERGEAIFIAKRGYSLLNIMFSQDDNRINLTENTQPAVFLSSAAIFSKLQKDRDFNPDFFIGHSVGEYTALFCSGILDFDDAMKLIIKRSDLMKEAAIEYPGRIMVVFGNEKETASLIKESGASWLYITNKNSEKQTAVSGSEQDIEIFCKFLTSRNVVYKRLNLSGAFHTPLFSNASEKLKSYLKNITFNEVDFSRVISNVTAKPYPQDANEIKELLAKQITTPVEFIKSIEYVHGVGNSRDTHFIEIGPRKLLVNLLKHINIKDYTISVALDSIASVKSEKEFLSTVNENAILISGVSVGLPGKARRVFSSDNFDMILDGRNFIEPLTLEDQEKIVDKNITRILKQPDGNARFVEITKTEDVIHLAGQLGYFNLNEEYGIKAQYDISMALAVAAGIEALKDASIPLVMKYKTPSRFKEFIAGKTDSTNLSLTNSSSGGNFSSSGAAFELIPDGFALPEEMQDETGVIVTSLFPSNETLINEMEKYFYDRLFLKPYEEFQSIYFYLMENIKEPAVKEQVTDWFFKIRKRKREELGLYKFDRNFMVNACPLGSAHLAQIIKAKGPNTLISSACASTTQAIGIAEDWIKLGRCKRVIVIGGENATSPAQNQWIGSGFLALGAATVKKRVSEAAKPFDSDRNGTILGAGAVGLVVEKASEVHARGMRGQAIVLGTHMANSAYHTFNIDVDHMASQMKKFISKMEREHNLKQSEYADKLLFMSHETYTPARGGSADAEVTALKTAFGQNLKNICITNTKGFTGHTLGAAIEDVVMVKALQKRKAPPIANLVNIPEHFRELNFATINASGSNVNLSNSGYTAASLDSAGGRGEKAEYGLHLAAGFGSHFAFLFIRRIEERVHSESYNSWLKKISGSDKPELKIIDNMLCVVGEKATKPLKLPEPSIQIKEKTDAQLPSFQIKEAKITPIASLPVKHGNEVMQVVTDIIAKQTGYTADMLEPELDLEADLGIDTVKQVEIFANAASHFGFAVPEDLKLRDLNTISKLASYIDSKIGSNSISSTLLPIAQHSEVEVASAQNRESIIAPTPIKDGQEVVRVVTDIIAKQTGYTADMLEPELDLEADLGIDTVKQVEIFANAASHFGFAVPEDLKLRDLNTIAKLAAYIDSKIGNFNNDLLTNSQIIDEKDSSIIEKDSSLIVEEAKKIEQVKVQDKIVVKHEQHGIKRLVPVWRKTGLPLTERWSFAGKTVVIAGDDIYGIADFIKSDNGIVFQIDAHYLNQVELMPQIESIPDADGLIFISPFDVKSFFLILKQMFVSLNQPNKFIAAFRGDLANSIDSEDSKDSINFKDSTDLISNDPSFAGICGMMKSLAKEMPNTVAKAVSIFNTPKPVQVFMDEIRSKDPRVEISYRNSEKYVVYLEDRPLNESQFAGNDSNEINNSKHNKGLIQKGDTILVSGGARGITFEILKSVVKKYQANLIILGRSPIYNIDGLYDAIADINNLVSIDETAIMERLKQTMKGAKPLELKKATKRIVSALESRKNIEILKSFGSYVTYIAVDVADREAVISAIQSLDVDCIDGVIHAAGVEESMPFEKKNLDSFERVFNTKVKGCLNVIEALKGKSVKFHVGFSSVTAKFGNEGQTDYTAANEMMAAILLNLTHGVQSNSENRDSKPEAFLDSQKSSPKCKIIDWTAWSGAGMATRETVQKVLTERGLKFLPLEAGVQFFMNEMEDSTTPEVVITGLDQSFDRDGILKIAPFLDSVSSIQTESISFTRQLEIKRDRFLLDHAMDGTPIFLGATGVETMAEAVIATQIMSYEQPPKQVEIKEIKNFSIPYGIKLLQNKPKDITITVSLNEDESSNKEDKIINKNDMNKNQNVSKCTITSQFVNSAGVVMGEPKLHYQAEFVIGDKDESVKHDKPVIEEKSIKQIQSITPIDLKKIINFSPITSNVKKIDNKFANLIYHPQRLFMDGLFRTIEELISFDGKSLITRVADRSKAAFFADDPCPIFLTDVVLLDAMFQTGGVFEFLTDSYIVLPYKIKSLKFFKRAVKDRDYFCITNRIDSNEETDTFNIDLVDESGDYLMELAGFEMVKLNRLSDEMKIIVS
ncbi:MAG: SDR family NAD(P)-dependent oxidoreductase [Desulfamplus sp.]|nr:SDR family NAD(P)-dependent oxidoreductase [Desulfamplus sp.]